MTLIGDYLFSTASMDRKITLAEAKQEIDSTLKGLSVHKSNESELWRGTEMNRDLFEPDALKYVEGRLTERLHKLWDKGETPLQWFGRSVLGMKTDSDGDGLTDRKEKSLGTNPFVADTNHNGWNDQRDLEAGRDPGKVEWK